MRPTISLVLGGGGSRGFAHIGVLEVIRRETIPIDFLVGTSMGGIIAVLYAMGHAPEQIGEDLRAAMSTSGFNMGSLRANSRKQRLEDQLTELVGERSFGDLQIPVSVTAVDMISGEQLPPPPLTFGGEIKEDALNSKPWWPPRVVPPKQAPNILLIMTDDSGFGVPSTFGGGIPTPTITEAVFARALASLKDQRVAAAGVLSGPAAHPVTTDRNALIEAVRQALLGATLVTYAQGLAVIEVTGRVRGWTIDLGTVAAIWRAGCVIRARLLDEVMRAYENPEKPINLDSNA